MFRSLQRLLGFIRIRQIHKCMSNGKWHTNCCSRCCFYDSSVSRKFFLVFMRKRILTHTYAKQASLVIFFPFLCKRGRRYGRNHFFAIHMRVIYFSQGNENEKFAKNLLTPIFSPLIFQHTVWIFTPIFPTQKLLQQMQHLMPWIK